MTDRPIIFSGPMVRAILDGRKTQTRRVLKPQPSLVPDPHSGPVIHNGTVIFRDRSGQRQDIPLRITVGDRLWVREACRAEELSRPPKKRRATAKERRELGRTHVTQFDELDGLDGVRYLACDAWQAIENTMKASDLWSQLYHYAGGGKEGIGNIVSPIHMPRWASRLTLTVTDVRVQRVQDISEADAYAEGAPSVHVGTRLTPLHTPGFKDLWDSLNAKRGFGWDANPWVAAYTFTVARRNIDQPGGAS